MSTGMTGKQRASRIPLDYYKRPNRLERWKTLLAAGAFGVALVWLASMAVGGKAQQRFSHGPCARAHQPIQHQCSECHVNFAVFSGKETFFKESASKCGSCHLDGGHAAHHVNQKDSSTPNCGVCHADHKGVDRDLTRMPDSLCTTCHANLEQHVKDKLKGYDKSIKSFVDGHQEFRLLRTAGTRDPGKIKFNHHYHMTEGITLVEGGKPFTLADIPERYRKEYRKTGQSDTSPVKLDCADCHKPDAGKSYVAPTAGISPEEKERSRAFFDLKQKDRGRFLEARAGIMDLQELLLPARKSGAYMAPIDYDRHCAACHQNEFDRGSASPHRLQPAALKEFVVGHYANQPPLPTPMIDRLKLALPKDDARLIAPPAERAEIAFASLMQSKCSKCHLDTDGQNVSIETKSIARAEIPSIWFKHSRFDHSKHAEKGMTCADCHDQAYPKKGMDLSGAYSLQGRQGAEQVMLPGIKKCQECHSPTPTIGKPELRAKFDCTECHNYHHGAAGR